MGRLRTLSNEQVHNMLTTNAKSKRKWFDLGEARIERFDFRGYYIDWVDFYFTDFVECSFRSMAIVGTRFFWANLVDADFAGADLCNVDFVNANISGANFQSAHFANCDFTGCDFRRAVNIDIGQCI